MGTGKKKKAHTPTGGTRFFSNRANALLQTCSPQGVELQRSLFITQGQETISVVLIAGSDQQETGRNRSDCHETHTQGANKRLPRVESTGRPYGAAEAD
jgi:hypothetical protein